MKKTGKWILGGIVSAAVLAGLFFGIPALTDPYDCRMVDGVTIGGLDVSGMTRGEARKALKAALEETLYTQELTAAFHRQPFVLLPADAEPKVSVRKAVSAAYQVGRDAAAETSEIGLLPYLTVNEAQIRTGLSGYAQLHDTQLTQPVYALEGEAPALTTDQFSADAPCQTLLVTRGIPTVHLDVDAAYQLILEEYNDVIGQCRAGTYGISMELIPEALPEEPDLQAIYDEFAVAPVDDSLSMETYQLISGSYGYSFDLEEAQKQLTSAEYGETIAIPMEYTQPEILGDGVYFRDVLGTCETRHTDDEKRNNNLRLVCEMLNDYIIQPGEHFSFNGVIGERTPERGFQPAPAYSGNRLIKDYGGGVCQTSTTLYNCVLLADLEVTDRVCHGVTVGYVPRGLDAAVNWATQTDMAFTNNWNFPIKIQAEVSDGYVKMKILGTDEKDYYIKMSSGTSEEEKVIYAVSYKNKYSKETDELISKDLEARSTYYKNIG